MKHTKSKTPRGGPSSVCLRRSARSSVTQIHECVPPNPKGRGKQDDSKAKDRLLSCKQYNNVATMNVRTIRLKSKQQELANNCSTHSIAILGIIDHKIVHEDDDIMYEQVEDRLLITSSAWRNASGAASGGVGLMINKTAEKALSEVTHWNKRIIVANFGGNPTTTIIVHYSPVEGSEEAEEHYNQLAAAVKEVPKHNMLVVMGDFNAHLDKSDAKYSYHDSHNSNGKLVGDFIEETGLFIANTHFQKKPGKLWTFISDMSGTKTQVDFIMINRKWRNSVHNCEAYNTFGSIGSDHRIVTAKIKLSLRTSKAPSLKTNYDWTALRDAELKDLYNVSVQNKYASLCADHETITETYAHLITANEETAKELLPQKKKNKRSRTSTDPRVMKVREETQKASAKYVEKPTKHNREKLQDCKRKLEESYEAVQEEELEKMIRDVESADIRSRHCQSWKIINEITGRKTVKRSIIKAKNKEDRIKKWYTHFQELLGKDPEVEGETDINIPPILQELGISDQPFTSKEYMDVKKGIKEGKACGPDGIPPEVLKRCDLDDIILDYINQLFTGKKPDQWSESDLKPLPKSGDLSKTVNYRGIALSSNAAKLANKMLLNRIRPKIDPLLRPNQNGFRPGRSTTSHILALRRLLEGVRSNNLKAVLVFIDFRQAFDSIHRGRMFDILRAYDIPEKIVKAIKLMYENTRGRVITPDGDTEYFDINAGVLQGDTLAPFLFAIVLDYAMRQAIHGKEEELGFKLDRRRSRRKDPIIITDMDFADDIALISEEIAQAQELLSRVEIESEKVGLHLNAKKTKIMQYNQDVSTPILAKNGKILEVVDNFKYLGGWMSNSLKDFEIRKALAWSACHKMSKIWKSNLKRKLKERLFLATVESVLLYGSETWTINKSFRKRLDGCYTRMLRMVLNISWKDKLTNEQLYGDLPPVSSKVAYRRLKLAGHCIRHSEEVASQLVLWQPKHGHRNVGRKAVTYVDTLMNDTDLENVEELKTAMMDRDDWRKRAESLRVETRPK